MGTDHESEDLPPSASASPSPRAAGPGSGSAAAAASGDPYVYTLRGSRGPASPKILRDFVACVLNCTGRQALVDTATVCTSELVTNAWLHAEGDALMLRVVIEPPRLRVLLYDGCAALPVPSRLPDGDHPHGRGLRVVGALADAWGTAEGDPAGAYAKAVWFELRSPEGASLTE
ncbi:ATP-binding protein [Streptomyces coffeae]|uniref:ATP-binding protein n=1 Tax=Streptomyces coffeae TaxID=621382 RepID=A0ABS1NH20_9ACTN|nr:ATP-binding protein [Streptomyces coffeae]MBL1099366.1 ATP-binding protein [Streptomyces coffeae]